MNASKLLKHNLKQPIALRISADELADKVAIARLRGNMAALVAELDNAPELRMQRRFNAFIASSHTTFQDFVNVIEDTSGTLAKLIKPPLPIGLPMPRNVCINPKFAV